MDKIIIFIAAMIMLLTAYNCNAEEVQLTWNAPDDSRVVGYYIWGVDEGTERTDANRVDVPGVTNTSHTFTLNNIGWKEFSAVSYDASGNVSDYSDTIRYYIEAPYEPQVIEIPRKLGKPIQININSNSITVEG